MFHHCPNARTLKHLSWIVPKDHPAGIYLLKVNNKNTRTRGGSCSNFEHISYLVNSEHVIAGWAMSKGLFNPSLLHLR